MRDKRQLAATGAIIVLISMMMLAPTNSRAHQQTGITALVWGPDGTRVATANFDGTLRIWDSAKQQLLTEIKVPNGRLDSITWKPDGTRIASLGADDGIIRIWNTENGQLVTQLSSEAYSDGRGVVAWSSDGTTLASIICSDTAIIHIWDATNDGFRSLGAPGAGTAYAIAWRPDSDALAVANIANLAVLDGIKTGNLFYHDKGPFVISVAWSPDGTKIAGGEGTGLIHILDAKTGKELNVLRGHTGGVLSLSWNSDGITLLSTSHDNTLRIWDTISGKTLTSMPFTNDIGSITKLADWSPDGGRLAFHETTNTPSSAQTQNSPEMEFQVVVPNPSTNELQSIAQRCATPAVQQQLTTRLAAKQYSEFANDVKAMSKDQIPPACAADLIAVASALQSTS